MRNSRTNGQEVVQPALARRWNVRVYVRNVNKPIWTHACGILLMFWWNVALGVVPRHPQNITWCMESSLTTMEDRYLCLLEMALTGSLTDEAGRCNGSKHACDLRAVLPYSSAMRFFGNDWPPLGHTMVGHVRLRNIRHTLEACIADSVEGDFAELGVWRGGASIYAKAVLATHGVQNRRVFVMDAFESLHQYGNHKTFLQTSESQVKHNFFKYGLLDSGVTFIRGLFKDSLPHFKDRYPETRIAVLRIDSNFYDSYQDALYYLYELVPTGGFVIFDDVMSHAAVMRCWQDFKKEQGLPEELEQIDDHSAFFRKTKQIRVNFSYFRQPQDANLSLR
mmetsp:Transcript_7093/g.43876  ORF Transcript_7093/g.43876 Transcript_7093/m.43876 type:complete len:336 (-) Transcript_7093:5493-6500(-)